MMRFDRFTERAQEAAQRAAEIIQRYGHNQIDTEHILLALIEQPQGVIPQILEILKIDPALLIERLDYTLRTSPKANIFGGGAGQIFITPRVKRIIDLANEEASRLKDEYISTEHIFLAILMIGTIAFLYLLKPFAYPIFWAAVIAGIFGPMYKRINRKLRHPNVSTAIMLVVVLLVIILPLVVITSILLAQAIDMYSALKDTEDIQQKAQGIINLLKGNPYLQKLDLDEKALSAIADMTGGKYFRATDNNKLMAIYKEIDKLERTKIEVTAYRRYTELFDSWLMLGLALVVLEVGVSSTVLRKVP